MADALNLTLGNVLYGPFTGQSNTNYTMNGAGRRIGWVFQAKEPITIARGGILLGSKTAGSGDYKLSLQGVDASGLPDGTIKGGGSPASKNFNPGSLGWSNSTFNWLTFDNSYACARGERLALVIEYATSYDGTNYSSFTHSFTNSSRHPYSLTYDGSSWAKNSTIPIFGYGSSGTAYGAPIQSASTHTFQSGSSPAEHAIKFSLPSGWGSTFTLAGVRVSLGMVAAGSLKVQLYDGGGASDTTVLQSVTIDQDIVATASANINHVFFADSSLATLNFGSTYRIGFQPQGSQTIDLNSFTVGDAADWDAHPLGQNVGVSTRSGGNWTDVPTRRLFADLIIADWTEPSGGGGGGLLLNSGMQGGLRG